MDIWQAFFSYRGRIGRGVYFGCNVLINILSICAQVMMMSATSMMSARAGSSPSASATGLVFGGLLLFLFLLWPMSAVLVKRGHDRGRPALFSISLLAAIVFLSLAGTYFKPAYLLLLPLGLYQLVDYLFWPASPKGKRYDLRPSPIAAAEVFS